MLETMNLFLHTSTHRRMYYGAFRRDWPCAFKENSENSDNTSLFEISLRMTIKSAITTRLFLLLTLLVM